MSVVFILLPLALVIAAVAVGAFLWAVRTGQLDDLDTPALRVLHDDEEGQGPAPPGGES
jgi:cbb3-type cytochrome oxidase maturation protein